MLPPGGLLRLYASPSWSHLRGTLSRAPYTRHFSTLDPARLTTADAVDLSAKASYSRDRMRLRLQYLAILRCKQERVPFPAGTHGFFYFAPGPAHAPSAGEVRFRITPGADPAHFADGRDLLLPNELVPWTVPLSSIVSCSQGIFEIFYEVLTQRDQVLGEELVAFLRKKKIKGLQQDTPIIHSLGQPFVQDLSAAHMRIWVTSGTSVFEKVCIRLPSGLQGLIRCSLEARTHEGRQGVALRVLEVLNPTQWREADLSGSSPMPVAGELLKTARGDVWMAVFHESHTYTVSVRALLSTTTAPVNGYIVRVPSLSYAKEGMPVGATMLRLICNLAPAKLAVNDWVDLSLQEYPILNVLDEASGTRRQFKPLTYDSFSAAFPPETTGFFYVYVPDPEHPVGAHLRFRVVPSPDPAAFDAGHDLRMTDGTVWRYWLPPLMRRDVGCAIASIVVTQDLVSRAAVAYWRTGDDAMPKSQTVTPLVYPGSEPIVWNLAKVARPIILGVGARARKTQIHSPFAYQVARQSAIPLLEGQMVVELEADHARQTYGLRVVNVSDVRVHPGHDRRVPRIPEAGALIDLGSGGRRLYTMTREMREIQSHAVLK